MQEAINSHGDAIIMERAVCPNPSENLFCFAIQLSTMMKMRMQKPNCYFLQLLIARVCTNRGGPEQIHGKRAMGSIPVSISCNRSRIVCQYDRSSRTNRCVFLESYLLELKVQLQNTLLSETG
jgi:hypothetical protein